MDDTKKWEQNISEKYFDYIYDVTNLIKLSGPQVYKITFIFICYKHYSGENKSLFIFLPFVKLKQDFNRQHPSYIFKWNDEMYVSKEFYQYIFTSCYNVGVLHYTGYSLLDDSNSVILTEKIKENDFEKWMENKNKSSIKIIIQDLYKFLPFSVSPIEIDIYNDICLINKYEHI
jgi:hypothetical protein